MRLTEGGNKASGIISLESAKMPFYRSTQYRKKFLTSYPLFVATCLPAVKLVCFQTFLIGDWLSASALFSIGRRRKETWIWQCRMAQSAKRVPKGAGSHAVCPARCAGDRKDRPHGTGSGFQYPREGPATAESAGEAQWCCLFPPDTGRCALPEHGVLHGRYEGIHRKIQCRLFRALPSRRIQIPPVSQIPVAGS